MMFDEDADLLVGVVIRLFACHPALCWAQLNTLKQLNWKHPCMCHHDPPLKEVFHVWVTRLHPSLTEADRACALQRPAGCLPGQYACHQAFLDTNAEKAGMVRNAGMLWMWDLSAHSRLGKRQDNRLMEALAPFPGLSLPGKCSCM